MGWHESDKDLESENAKSIKRQHQLDLKSRAERKYQQGISCLKMVETPEVQEIEVDGISQKVNVVKFYPPKNFAGDDMDEDYRISQKADLIANNNKRLEP